MKRATALVLAAVVIGGAVIAYGMAGRRGSLMRELAGSTPERTFAARTAIRTEYHECTTLSANGSGTVPRESCAEPRVGPLKPRALDARAGERRSGQPAGVGAVDGDLVG